MKYLDTLQFDAKNFGSFLRNYVTNMRVVALLLMALLLGGVVSYFTLPRTLNPEINITIVTVATALPGATPEDVEELLTVPLEDEIESVDDIDVLTSTSRENSSVIVIQFLDGIDQGRALTDVQNAVDRVSDLPDDATDPSVDVVDFEDTPIIRYALTGNSDMASLNRFARDFRDRLEEHAFIDRVEISGDETQEVQITVAPEALAALDLDLQTVSRVVATATSSYPAGTVETESGSFGLTIDRGAVSVADLRQVTLRVGTERYTLGDFATVTERSAPGRRSAFITPATDNAADAQTQRAVTLDIYRVIDSKITDAADAVATMTEQTFTEEISQQFALAEILNTSKDIEKEFTALFRNLTLTTILVFIVLLVFVGFRQALVAAFSIPLVFMAAFIVMRVTDISLNFLSIFSLLLSLGLLVDVTIVIVSAMTSYARSGKFTPQQTGLLVWKDFFVTLSVTTLTTVWAFVPLLLAGGIIGEFIKPIPVIVSAVLGASVLIGFFIILPLMVWLLDFHLVRRVRIFFGIVFLLLTVVFVRGMLSASGITLPSIAWVVIGFLLFLLFFTFIKSVQKVRHKQHTTPEQKGRKKRSFTNGFIRIKKVEDFYRRVLSAILERRILRIKIVVMVIIFFVFSVALVPLGYVKNEFFPGDDFDLLYVTITLPVGTKESVTQEEARRFVTNFVDVPDLQRVQTQVGVTIDADGNPSGGSGTHTILYTLQLLPKEERVHGSKEIAQMVRDKDALTQYTRGTLRVIEVAGGPPAGADITLKLRGDDLQELDRLAEVVIANLAARPGVLNPKKSIESGTAKIVFVPDPAKLALHGITVADVGFFLRSFGSGLTIDEDVPFTGADDSRDIVLRMSTQTQDAASLGRVLMPLPAGQRVPLASLGAFVLKQNPTEITREDGSRTISVTAAVAEGFNAQEINTKLGAFADGDLRLPAGYTWETGGANEENNKSVQSIIQAMLLAFILIFLTLIIRLNSYRKSLIVLLVIPLAISGVFVVFAIVGLPLSFPSLIGLLALFGIVINNSIIIIDQINKNLSEGIDFHHAVVDGSASRLEPILLSSLTTVIGLLPITLTEPVWQGLGGAIIAGLLFSGVIMLFFIPTVFYTFFWKEEKEKEPRITN